MDNSSTFRLLDTPTAEVAVYLPDGRGIVGPRGAAVADFLQPIAKTLPAPLMGAVVNGDLRELTFPIQLEAQVRPVTLRDSDGIRIYRRSLVFLLEVAFSDLFPQGRLIVDHSVVSGGYFCRAQPALDQAALRRLEAHMRELVQQNLPIVRAELPLDEAIAYFQTHGHTDKVRLLRHRAKDYLTVYRLGEYLDYHHGYMVPATGYLRWFALAPAEGGFILRFPQREHPTTLPPLGKPSKLLATFRQYGDWLRRLGINNVGSLNDAVESGRIREVVLVSEALHEQRIAEIAAKIAAQREAIRVVLIAGPSSSGKTTFSKRLTVQLLTQGLSPFPLELDNYFVDRKHTPRDAQGNYDFEHIDALDRDRLAEDVHRLLRGEAVQLPRYNFKTGHREPGEVVQLAPGQLIIMEGIHGLNPRLLPGIPREQTFRIYVSALTQLNLDCHNRVSTTDTRLLRRIVRDARDRGYSAQETIDRWEAVRRGEKRWIFPFQEEADVMFNSALVYELAVLKTNAVPLLLQVPHHTPAHIEAKRLLSLLEWFVPVEARLVPDDSLLREFIGGSILSAFLLWHNDLSSGQ